jgi:hypothetical protein
MGSYNRHISHYSTNRLCLEEDCLPGKLHHAARQKLPDTSEVLTALMIEAVGISKTSIIFYLTKWHIITEDTHLHTCCRKNLKPHQTLSQPHPSDYKIDYLVLKALAVGISFQYTFGCGQAIVTNFFTMSGY